MTSTAVSQSEGLRAGLEAYLSSAYEGKVSVAELRRLTGGTSHETWSFDLLRNNAVTPLVLRRDFSGDPLHLSLSAEFGILRSLFDLGIPVPEPHFCEQNNPALGSSFIISERLQGRDIRKEMAKNSSAARQLGQRLTEIQARIHQIDWSSFVSAAGLSVTEKPVVHEVSSWCDLACRYQVTVEPMLRYAIDWLEAKVPESASVCLVHGDFKANNLLLDSNNRVAVIDWELAHIGDPYEDLAFTMLWTTEHDIVGGMLERSEYLSYYEKATGEPVDLERLRYWQVFSLVKLAAIFFKGYADDIIDQVERPSRLMLVKAMPWINYQLAFLFNGWFGATTGMGGARK